MATKERGTSHRSRWFLVVPTDDNIGGMKYLSHEYVGHVMFQVWTPVCTVHGAHCDLGRPSERDPGENASSVEARCLHSGRKRNKPLALLCMLKHTQYDATYTDQSEVTPVIFLPTHCKPAELVTQWCE